MPANAGGI